MKKEIIMIALAMIIGGSMAQAQNSAQPEERKHAVSYLSAYPLFITKKANLETSKTFYKKWFAMEIVFESTWFVLFATPGEQPMYLAFMSEDHPTSPPSSPALTAQSGVCLTLQVADAKKEYDRLIKAGAKISYNLKDEAWGQKRFGLIDPNGMYVDVVQQTEPEAGYWDKYMIKDQKK